jgi:hypothetical protein
MGLSWKKSQTSPRLPQGPADPDIRTATQTARSDAGHPLGVRRPRPPGGGPRARLAARHQPAQRTTQVTTALGVGRVLNRSCLQGYPAEQTAGGPLRQQEAASTVSKALSRKVLANEPSTRWARRPPRLFAQVADDHARNRRHQPNHPALRDLPRDRSNPRFPCCNHVADPSLPLTAGTPAAASPCPRTSALQANRTGPSRPPAACAVRGVPVPG